MRIIDETVLDQFRFAPKCEWCGRAPRRGVSLEPHHIHGRGFGGGSRLDVRINLAALCRECHQSHHDGHRPLRCDLQAVVAAREGRMQDDIMEEIYELMRRRR